MISASTGSSITPIKYFAFPPYSLTIVAENFASLQQQVRLKDSEIERLNQELETVRQEQHQLQLDQVKKKLISRKKSYYFIIIFREIKLIFKILTKISGRPSSTRSPTSS